ncbi:hypothetical protein T492DRAFT_1040914, partial [Pavlovales sp. CCMP2436]
LRELGSQAPHASEHTARDTEDRSTRARQATESLGVRYQRCLHRSVSAPMPRRARLWLRHGDIRPLRLYGRANRPCATSWRSRRHARWGIEAVARGYRTA